jgi:hypothetical protein
MAAAGMRFSQLFVGAPASSAGPPISAGDILAILRESDGSPTLSALISYSYQHFIRSSARILWIRADPIASTKLQLLSSAQGIIVFPSLPKLLKRTIRVTIVGVGLSFLGHSDPALADFLSEPGGSNLVFISQHEYTPLPLGSAEAGNCAAYAMGDARSVIAVYDVAKAAIDAKLRSLYAAGQRKISLVLWHFFNQYTYAPPQTTYLDTYCEMVRVDGILTSRHQANLSALIGTIKTVGFTQINFRFAPMDVSDPMSWSSWDEVQFQSNWNLIWQTRQLIYQSLDSVPGVNPRVLYDLGLELGGMWAIPELYAPANPEIFQQYVKTLWSVYTYNFGVSDTIGFSIVPGFSGQISAQIAAYDSNGSGRPNAYGFDLYGDAASVATGDYSSFDVQLDFISSELGTAGELSKELFIQETYANSALARNALSQAPQKGISFQYLFQWPYRAGHATNSVDVFDLSPYFSYASNGAPYPSSQLFLQPGTFIYQDSLYHTNGFVYCRYTAVKPDTGGIVSRIPATMKNAGFCSPAIPIGWFRVSDKLYYSYGSTYCSSNRPDADQVSGSTVFWGIFSMMTYVGGC